MPNYFLIKRKPEFAKSGALVKRKTKGKGYSETVITAQKRRTLSEKLNKGDVIYVAETQDGIYAKGKVTKVGTPIDFCTVEEIIKYIIEEKKKDDSYWMDKLKRFKKKKETNPNTVLRFHEYFIDQVLTDRTIPLTENLERLGKGSPQSSFIKLKDGEIEFIENPVYEDIKHLKDPIPARLRFDVYSLLNKKYSIQHWIDIDHFVPRSTKGPGNIIENLVPVGMSINRYKKDAVPKGLFKIASEHEELKRWALKEFLETDEEFLKKKDHKKVKDCALKINEYIGANFEIQKAKEFYLKVIEEHLPHYADIIRTINS